MVVIKKLAITLLELMFLAILVILVGIFVSENMLQSPSNNTSTTDNAVSIAMKDPGVQMNMALNKVTPIIESKPFHSNAIKGFLNFSDNLTAVLVTLRSPSIPPPDYIYYFIIDTDTGVIMDRTSFFDVMAGDDDIIIPAGSAWYYNISRDAITMVEPKGSKSETFVKFSAKYTPENATLYQAIVNEKGFEKLRITPAGTPLYATDIAGDSLVFNGTHPRSSGWNGSVILPSVEAMMPYSRSTGLVPDGSYYLVFINGDDGRAVNLTLRVLMQGTAYY